MEKAALTLLGAIFSLGIAGCTVWYYYLALFKPADFMAVGKSGLTWKHYVLFLAVVIGTGVCAYGGTTQAFSWMPTSWTTANPESGRPEWIAHSIAGLIAAFAGIGLPAGAAHVAKRIVDLEKLVEALRSQGR